MTVQPKRKPGTCIHCGTAFSPIMHRDDFCSSVCELEAEHDRSAENAAAARDIEWQEHLLPLHDGLSGDGCDSGDPRDWTKAAIQLRINRLIDALEEAREEMRRMAADCRGFSCEVMDDIARALGEAP